MTAPNVAAMPGPGDLGGGHASAPCTACDGGGDLLELCPECEALTRDPIEAVCALRETERALGAAAESEERMRRERDLIAARLREIGGSDG